MIKSPWQQGESTTIIAACTGEGQVTIKLSASHQPHIQTFLCLERYREKVYFLCNSIGSRRGCASAGERHSKVIKRVFRAAGWNFYLIFYFLYSRIVLICEY